MVAGGRARARRCSRLILLGTADGAATSRVGGYRSELRDRSGLRGDLSAVGRREYRYLLGCASDRSSAATSTRCSYYSYETVLRSRFWNPRLGLASS